MEAAASRNGYTASPLWPVILGSPLRVAVLLVLALCPAAARLSTGSPQPDVSLHFGGCHWRGCTRKCCSLKDTRVTVYFDDMGELLPSSVLFTEGSRDGNDS